MGRKKLTTTDKVVATNGAVDNTAPLSQEWQLASGVIARFEMPDFMKFANGDFDIPNQFQADIYELIYGNTVVSINPAVQLNFSRSKLRGLVGVFAIVCVSPKFVISDDDRLEGELGPRNLGWIDLTAAYNFFRLGPPRKLPTSEMQEPEMVTNVDDTTTTSE